MSGLSIGCEDTGTSFWTRRLLYAAEGISHSPPKGRRMKVEEVRERNQQVKTLVASEVDLGGEQLGKVGGEQRTAFILALRPCGRSPFQRHSTEVL